MTKYIPAPHCLVYECGHRNPGGHHGGHCDHYGCDNHYNRCMIHKWQRPETGDLPPNTRTIRHRDVMSDSRFRRWLKN